MSARILVIEDNGANLELMRYLLTAFGYTVEAAMDGQRGLELMRSAPFDLVICDIQLPILDGYAVARARNSEVALRDVPLIAVSALAMVGDRDRILGSGFDGYIAKPLAPQTFVSQVETYLPEGRRSAGSPVRAPDGVPTVATRPEPQRSILVVDDVRQYAEVLRSVLEPNGFRVMTARDGAQALTVLERFRPDLILSDLHFGAEPDFEFLERVRADERLRDVPFVFISSTSKEASLAREGMRRGVQRFLFRPIAPETLLAELRAILGPSPAAETL